MKKILGTVAVAAALAATPAHATNGMRMIGFGPIQNGMGGAGAAEPSDSAAVVSNPAGLTGVAPRVDLAIQAFMPKPKYTATWTPNGLNFFQASQSSERPTDWLPTLGAVFKLSDQVTLAVAAMGTNGMGVDYPAGPNSIFQAATMSSYVNGRLAPAIAYKLNDQLSFGLAVNIMYAQMEFRAVLPTPLGPVPAHFPSDGSIGYGATLGVTYKPTKMVTLGVAYETKSDFQDFEFTVGEFGGQKFKLGFDQPQVATIGAAVRPVEGLLLALDGQWINWSDIMGKNLPKFTSPPGAGGFNMNWDDQFVLKFGVEWAAMKELKLRAGYNYGKSPVDPASAYEAILFPAIVEHHITVGAGYEIGQFVVNAAFVYVPEKKISGSNPAQGIVSYETKMSQTAFELGASYRF